MPVCRLVYLVNNLPWFWTSSRSDFPGSGVAREVTEGAGAPSSSEDTEQSLSPGRPASRSLEDPRISSEEAEPLATATHSTRHQPAPLIWMRAYPATGIL